MNQTINRTGDLARPKFSNRSRIVGTLRRAYFRYSYRLQLRMGWHPTFSQMGEDLIVLGIFGALGIQKPTYLDVGAYDPYHLSNTALLYLRGCRGINVEPNPKRFPAFLRERPQDINLNIGIADAKGELDYYEMSIEALNTFSKESAEELAKDGYSTIAKRSIPVRTLNDVVDAYCNSRFPDFLSLDIEGMELPILRAVDYNKSSPMVICAETMSFSVSRNGVKKYGVHSLLESKGYFVYADTHLNTLFVKDDAYHRSKANGAV